jgi:S1-C subfamily serine protease
MPVQASNLKQTPNHHILMAALSDAIHLLPHHAQPFRRRHIMLLIVSLAFLSAIVLEVASVVARNTLDPRSLFSQSVTDSEMQKRTIVRSSLGFGFVYNQEQFSVSAQTSEARGDTNVTALSDNKPLSSVVLKPLPSLVPAGEAATELEVKVETDAAAFAAFKSSIKQKMDIAGITADYFAPPSTNLANIHEEARTTETIGGSLMTKTIYVTEPKFAGDPTHTIVWSTQVEGKAVALIVRGIVSGTAVPSSMQHIVQSMQFSTDVKVKGLSVFAKNEPIVIDEKYVADLVSPAVVKIYHAVCGSLEYMGNKLSDDTCAGKAGSGFLVSGDGYIATNGHVVVYGAKDMLAEALLQNKALLEQYLQGMKLNQVQTAEIIGRADLTAAVIARIYDIPDSSLRLTNQREFTIIALGNDAYEISDQEELKRTITQFKSTDKIKHATVVGYDYAAKDQLTLISQPDKGFSASDVALLKIDTDQAPYISLSHMLARQNQAITLLGFPSDADNNLIDQSKLDVTVTNGTINAVRDTSGTGTKLYQTDADASHGSSGGPAVDEVGNAIGILTYRYDSGISGDAAKSYVRDIKDFQNLVVSKQVSLSAGSDVQDAWKKGLDFYSRHYYSKALQEFEKVQRLYPAHRLAEQYADMSRQAIKDGKDIKDPSALLLIIGAGAGLGGIAAAALFIIRHYGNHRLYKFYLHHKPHLQASH